MNMAFLLDSKAIATIHVIIVLPLLQPPFYKGFCIVTFFSSGALDSILIRSF